jgi:hypothetical protein
VSSEVRDLFQYIERFKPQEMELEFPLKCFLPEYIPAIGEMDAFIKVRLSRFIDGMTVFIYLISSCFL